MSFKELKVERVEGELAVALSEGYSHYNRDFVKIGQKKWFLPYRYVKEGDNIYNFEIRPDDTWIITYPRSGKLISLSDSTYYLFHCYYWLRSLWTLCTFFSIHRSSRTEGR